MLSREILAGLPMVVSAFVLLPYGCSPDTDSPSDGVNKSSLQARSNTYLAWLDFATDPLEALEGHYAEVDRSFAQLRSALPSSAPISRVYRSPLVSITLRGAMPLETRSHGRQSPRRLQISYDGTL